MFPETCPLCGSRASLLNDEHPGYKKPQTFRIWMCGNCDTQYADPLKVDAAIYDAIYANPSAVRGYSRYCDAAEFVMTSPAPLRRLAELEEPYWFVAESLSHVPLSADILEIGCGLGYLTYAVNRTGYRNARGMDISRKAVSRATKKYGPLYFCDDLFRFAETTNERFDLVYMTELIEHLPDIVEFTKAAARLLKTGGRILISTPNKSAHLRNAYWRTDNPPVHLWWLSETSMRQVAIQAGLRVCFFDWTGWFQRRVLGLPDAVETMLMRPIGPALIESDGSIIPHLHARATHSGLKGFTRKLLGDAGYDRLKHAIKAPIESRNFYRRAARTSAAHSDTIGAIYRSG